MNEDDKKTAEDCIGWFARFPVQVNPQCEPDTIYLLPSDLADRIAEAVDDDGETLDIKTQYELIRDIKKAARDRQIGVIKNLTV